MLCTSGPAPEFVGRQDMRQQEQTVRFGWVHTQIVCTEAETAPANSLNPCPFLTGSCHNIHCSRQLSTIACHAINLCHPTHQMTEMERAVCHVWAKQQRRCKQSCSTHWSWWKSYYNQAFPVVHALSNRVNFILGGSGPMDPLNTSLCFTQFPSSSTVIQCPVSNFLTSLACSRWQQPWEVPTDFHDNIHPSGICSLPWKVQMAQDQCPGHHLRGGMLC